MLITAKLESELREVNKIRDVDLNLHDIKEKFLVDYTGDFEMIGTLIIGENVGNTHIRFEKLIQPMMVMIVKALFLMVIFKN